MQTRSIATSGVAVLGAITALVFGGCGATSDETGSPIGAVAGTGGGPPAVEPPVQEPAAPPDPVLDPVGLDPQAPGPSEPSGLPLGTATLTGTVWAPGNAPGMVPADQEIPISGALVQVSAEPSITIQEGAHCEQCVPPTGRHVLSDSKGLFQLPQLPAGNYLLSIRKGQFALQTSITITEGETRALDPAQTTLPSVHAPEQGSWVPRIALATGAYDHLEDILGKMGLGGVNGEGAWLAGGPGAERIDIFANGGRPYDRGLGDIAALVSDLELLKQYHLVFIPCSSVDTEVLQDPAVLKNLQQYVALGGKLYVTDWSGSWHDNVFPSQVRYTAVEDTPPEAYDRVNDMWNLGQLGITHRPLAYDSPNAEAIDQELFDWLDGQIGPLDEIGTVGTIQAASIHAAGSWNLVEEVVDTAVGVDMDGNQVIDQPRVFVIGGTNEGAVKHPLTLTYQPAGCGRVLYSTYHTTEQPHLNLVPQERILLYLIMEITVCRDEPVPVTPVR